MDWGKTEQALRVFLCVCDGEVVRERKAPKTAPCPLFSVAHLHMVKETITITIIMLSIMTRKKRVRNRVDFR
jgi:hypothetical protein